MNKRYGSTGIFASILCCVLFLVSCGSSTDEGLEIRCTPGEISAFQGEKVVLTVEVINNMQESFRPRDNFFLSYHIYDTGGNKVAYDNRRFVIPRVLRKKKTTRFNIPLFFDHPNPGEYLVEFDIVKEGEFWGSARGWKTTRSKLRLESLFSQTFKKKHLTYFCDTGNEMLNREQYLLRMTLKNCEMWKDGVLFGFAAGSNYPAVWIRDTATFMAYARSIYPFETLARMLELFLEHQDASGEVVDWVDIHGNTDKNTVETDQESSLVLAAYALAGEPRQEQWLQKDINGKTVLQRLDMALEWAWKNRRHKKKNLITSGFTADWGDVENSYPDKRARKLSDRSTLVFGIYTQAKYLQAIQKLTRLLELPGEKNVSTASPAGPRIQIWKQRAKILAGAARKHLYLEDKGYFILHRVVSPTKETKKYFDLEKEMLAVGGNAEAILAGLMTKEEVPRFLGVLERGRKEHKLRTVSFTLIPPYPEGFFPHHLLTHPWNYQNGGEWDWIGARVVNGLYRMGYVVEAEKYLMEIVNKNLANFCLYEWEDYRGTGRGALFYAGAAGVIGEVLFKHCCPKSP